LYRPERTIAGFAIMMMMSCKVEVEGTDNLPMMVIDGQTK
jgi:hypothetical protein